MSAVAGLALITVSDKETSDRQNYDHANPNRCAEKELKIEVLRAKEPFDFTPKKSGCMRLAGLFGTCGEHIHRNYHKQVLCHAFAEVSVRR
ncbi:MAG TPA: hypothetical protein VGI85_01870 [Chthoniobacterales bacterium]|jgi:hypothetical protein